MVYAYLWTCSRLQHLKLHLVTIHASYGNPHLDFSVVFSLEPRTRVLGVLLFENFHLDFGVRPALDFAMAKLKSLRPDMNDTIFPAPTAVAKASSDDPVKPV